MTTIINIETSTYQLPLSFRWVLVLPCLLVMVSSCRTAATTQVSLDLNTYQTGHTLAGGSSEIRFAGPALASTLAGNLSKNGFRTENALMLIDGLESRFGVIDGWEIGLTGRVGVSPVGTLIFDGDAAARIYSKFRLTSNSSDFAMSAIISAESVGGSKSSFSYDTSAYKYMSFITPQDSNFATWGGSIASSLWRISLSIPITFAVSLTEDIIIHPGLHYSEHRIKGTESKSFISKDSTTNLLTGIYQVTPWYDVTNKKDLFIISNSRDFEKVYKRFIPSLSIGYRNKQNNDALQPELTLALTEGSILWSFGFGWRIMLPGMSRNY